MSDKTLAFIKRFAKGAVAGGISTMLLQLNNGVTVHSVADLKQFGASLVIAFTTGAFLAIEKMWNWQEMPK